MDSYRAALDIAVRNAQTELASAMKAVRKFDPEVARNAIIEVFGELTAKHGDVAASAAAELYEGLRQQAFPSSSFRTLLAPSVSFEQAEATVRYAAEHLFNGDPDKMLDLLNGNLQRYVENAGRDTIRLNAGRDPHRPRWARVPAGGKTCAWCLTLASRGWVYSSATSGGGEGNEFHNDDRCMVVPGWGDSPQLPGYDPATLEAKYLAARRELESERLSVSDKAVAGRLRDMYPDLFTDGNRVPAILREPTLGWPHHVKAPTPGDWAHILARHAPGGTAVDTFPEGFTAYDIAKKVRSVMADPALIAPHHAWPNVSNFYKELDGAVYVVGTKTKGGVVRVTTAFPPSPGGGILEVWNSWKKSR